MDELAKVRAERAAAPAEVVERFVQRRERAQEVAWVVAAVQLQRLRRRLRTGEERAVKARKRRAPALPRRLKGAPAKRVCIRREERPDGTLRDLLMPGARANVTAQQARTLLEQDVAEPEFHDLWPLGPWPGAGDYEAKHGRLQWPWMCRRCGKGAGDSSRVMMLAKSPC